MNHKRYKAMTKDNEVHKSHRFSAVYTETYVAKYTFELDLLVPNNNTKEMHT